MDDEEDVKKMIEFLKCTKEENVQEFQYEEFINCEGSDAEAEEIDINTIIEDEIIYCDLSNTDISKLNSYDPINSLKPEERVVIDSCPDAELKRVLLLNRTKNMELIQLYKKMKDLLIECQENIMKKTKVIKAHVEDSKDQGYSTGAWRLAAPYFKDKQLYSSPPNADTIRKKNNNELCTYDLLILPKWLTIECEKMIRAVKLNYNINQQTEVVKAMQKAKQVGNVEFLEELETRKKELQGNENSEIPPLNSNEHIDWMRVSDVFLKDKHSAFECQSFWHIYLHPLINKSAWTPKENAKLKEIAIKRKFQNWDEIASDLGTSRTGFTACMNYFGNLHDRFKKGEFTHQEDSRLLELVQQYKMGSYIPWTKIVQHFKKRTRSQLHYRYTYYLSQNDKRRGKFTDAEDVLLMIIVDKFGKNFKKCCEYLPTRSMVQCKARYSSNLRNSIKKGSFTLEEDNIIVQYVEEHGLKSWANLTEELRRSRGQIRQRYLTIKQFLDSNPNSTIAAVPRRRHKELAEDSFPYLRSIADEYKDKPVIPSLEEIEEVLFSRNKKNNSKSDEDSEDDGETELNVRFANTPPNNVDVDEMLTDFFCNTIKMNAAKVITLPNVSRAACSVKAVLEMLKADLDIPENFDEDMALDNLDVAILNELTESESQRCLHKNTGSKDTITDLLPPNLNTVIGLRSLLIKFSRYRSEEKQMLTKLINGAQRQSSSKIRSDIVKHFLCLPPDVKKEVEADRKLFYKRFQALFKWPALMTLENPSSEILSMAKGLKQNPNIQVKRTYSRRDPTPVKRVKISELPSTSSKAVPIKLTPVTDRSILEDLLQDKSKKLFCFNQVKSGGQTKTIIKEIPISEHLMGIKSKEVLKVNAKGPKKEVGADISFEVASSSNQESSRFDVGHGECVITGVDEDTESVVTGAGDSIADEEEDLKKLDVLLNTECQEDEYEDDDMEDLKKLNIFLKNEVDGDTTDHESFV